MKNIFISYLLTAILYGTLFSQQDPVLFDLYGNNVSGHNPLHMLTNTPESGNPWVSVGPFGGDVLDIAMDPTNAGHVYLAAGFPYFRTSEDQPWTIITTLLNLSPSGVHCMEANDQGVIYAGGNYTFSKILKSSDQGATWQQLFTNVNAGVLTIALDQGNQSNMYLGTTSNISGSVNKVIVKSTDGGTSWTALDMTSYFPIGMGCNGLAVDPGNSNIIVALGDGGFSFPPKAIISFDGGTGWQDITSGLPSGKPFNEVTIYDETIYICGGQLFGGNSMGIFKSDDYGQTWQDISTGFPVKVVNDILIDPEDPDLMYAATEGDGVYYSLNGGSSWNYGTGGAGNNGSVRKIQFTPGNTAKIYAGFLSLGVLVSDDYGYNWSSSSIGIASLTLNDIEIDPNNPEVILASFEAENSGGCYLFDPGQNDWALVSNLPATRFSSVSIGIDGRMYAWSNGPTTVAAEGVYRSGDGGQTWENMGPNIGPVFETQIFAMALSETDPDLIFIGGNNFGANGWASMIYRSKDAGESWENVFSGPQNDGFKFLHIVPSSGDMVVYAAYKTETSGAGFLKSIDGGENWFPINTGIPASAKWAGAIISDHENPDILFGGVGGYGGTPGKVYKSEDGGSSWSALNMTLTSYSKVSDLLQSPLNPDVIYAATTLNGVYLTEDGENWTPSNDGLPADNVTAFSKLFENEDEQLGFYASTFSNSAFYTKLYEPGAIGMDESLKNNDGISIFPNPSDGNFSVDMGMLSSEEVLVSIYGITGNKIDAFKVDQGFSANLTFSLNLGKGLYFVIIQTGNRSFEKKLLID